MRYLSFLIVLLLLSYGAYLDSSNIWIQNYKKHRNMIDLKHDISQMQKELKKNLSKNKRDEISKDLEIATFKLALYTDKGFNFISIVKSLDMDLSKIDINLFNYISKSPINDINNLIKKHQILSSEYEDAMSYLKEELNEYESISDDKMVKIVNKDIKYFIAFKDILVEQKHNLEYKKDLIYKKMDTFAKIDLIESLLLMLSLSIPFAIIFASKFFINRYIEDEDRKLKYIKIMVMAVIILLSFFIIFKYTENIRDAFALIGLIGMGITIVLKENILNVLGWLYMTFSNRVNVGDRIFINDSGRSTIGDVMAITISNIIIYEGITYNSLKDLKRSGRIAFIPNNFLFNKVIYNYTYKNMKTLYDLIEMDFSFDSDFKSLEKIAENSVDRFASRYISLAKNHYSELKNRYVLKNKNFSPKIQFIVSEDKNGITMYLWYVAPYREIIDTRSNITLDIIKQIKDNQDIKFLS